MGVEEALTAPSEFGSDAQAGVEQISSNQAITFTKYVRIVLPLDGFVFWVKADLLSPSAIFNTMGPARFNQAPRIETPANTLIAQGSLHYSTELRQDESETYAANRVVFTSQTQIRDLSDINPNTLYIGEIDGIKFAFSTRGSFYRQAALWHYIGYAVYSDMATQLVDSVRGFDSRDLIVSNSLPIWLSLNGLPPLVTGLANPVTLYPSFVVPNNLLPPYGAVHIDNTKAIASAPLLSPSMSHSQLVQERVKITLYGLRNAPSLDFLDFVLQYSVDNDILGIMNQPIVQDEKRTQSELGTIAQKKTIEFEVNYYQSSVRDVARQLILRAVPSFNIQ